jgi:hypothetical protein
MFVKQEDEKVINSGADMVEECEKTKFFSGGNIHILTDYFQFFFGKSNTRTCFISSQLF